MDSYTFGIDTAAIEMAEAFSKFDNKNFKKAYIRAVQNFDGHLNSLLYNKMDAHSKAYFLESILPNVINTFNGIRENYRGRKNSYHMNVCCGKAITHFRWKIKIARNSIVKG